MRHVVFSRHCNFPEVAIRTKFEKDRNLHCDWINLSTKVRTNYHKVP